jgi:hypothetical protein
MNYVQSLWNRRHQDFGEAQMAKFRQLASRNVVSAFVAAALSLVGKAQAVPLTIGPVEQVNVRSSTIVVLGQTYHVGSGTSVINKVAGSHASLRLIAPGTFVVIDGTESAAGISTVQSVGILSQQNVPGATQLLVTGIVSSVSSTGRVRIGKLTVDVNATLTNDSQRVAVGDLIQVSGTQPNPSGLFLAQGIGGSGLSAAGIGGSGSVANGIGGSGATAAGIGGSGSVANGIGGSGATAAGIGGSGSVANGIGGSGATAAGIGGSGSVANGIGGSGATAAGIGGSGSVANGIGGSGATAAGIGGSGSSAKGIGGSGSIANGIGGSGATAAGIGGSGSVANGIGGSGATAAGIGGSGSSV